MIARLLFLFALTAAQAAHANCGNDKPNGQGCTEPPPVSAPVVTVTGTQQTTVDVTNQNSATARSASEASAWSSSMSGALAVSENYLSANGGQGGQGGSGFGGQSSSSVVFNTPRVVSMAYAPPVQATATCAIPLAAGLTFINFGGSFGTAYVDQNCALLEQVRAVAQLGDTETAFEMLCSSKPYAAARERQGRPCRK